jgi:hypothetical protein
MTHYALFPVSLSIAIATIMSGCATSPQMAPAPAPAASLDCRTISAEIAAAKETRRAANESGDNAWKAVIPVAVVARFAQGKKTAAEAQERIEQHQAAASRKACLTPW